MGPKTGPFITSTYSRFAILYFLISRGTSTNISLQGRYTLIKKKINEAAATTTPTILEIPAANLNPSGACNKYEQETATIKVAGRAAIQEATLLLR